MKGKTIFVLTIVLFSVQRISAQQIKGIVVNVATGENLVDAIVFINNTTISSKTNLNGEFSLDLIPSGFVTLVIYKKYFQLFKSAVRIQSGRTYTLKLPIQPIGEHFTSKGRRDESYKQNLMLLESVLLSDSLSQKGCRLITKEGLTFLKDGDNILLNKNNPIIIENHWLGLKIEIYQSTDIIINDKMINSGLFRFEALPLKNSREKANQEQNIINAYRGSVQHLLRSLANDQLNEEGFRLINEAGNSINSYSIALPGKLEDYFEFKIDGKIQIEYSRIPGMEAISSDKSFPADAPKISWLKASQQFEFTQLGVIFNDEFVQISGDMNRVEIAKRLPTNFVREPENGYLRISHVDFSQLQENVYIQTDKDYYYPQEYIWFAAYLSHRNLTIADSLSKLLYVELIDPNKVIIQTRMVKISNGAGNGEFKLPDTLITGSYYLRAYTNWMRNYGDSTLFVKVVPILDYASNVVSDWNEHATPLLGIRVSIENDKKVYKPREKIRMDITLTDSTDAPVKGSLSLAITDMESCARINGQPNILAERSNFLKNIPNINRAVKIRYHPEKGISVGGITKNENGDPIPSSLEVVQGNFESMISVDTDQFGRFLITDLEFDDSLSFTFKPTTVTGKFTRNMTIFPHLSPSTSFAKSMLRLKFKKFDALQRIQNTYMMDGKTIVLKEVEVKGRRIKDSDIQGKYIVKMYGEADYVLSGAKLASTGLGGSNILLALQGRVPGVTVSQVGLFGGIRISLRNGSSSPLILVDGVPFDDPSAVSSIPASEIEYIDIIKRALPQFGSRGSGGVIAIYTRTGAHLVRDNSPKGQDFIIYKIRGFDRPKAFSTPEYTSQELEGSPDFRSTIFWNPNLTIGSDGKASVTFFAADLPGYYQVIIEGITEKNKPFRSESLIEVD